MILKHFLKANSTKLRKKQICVKKYIICITYIISNFTSTKWTEHPAIFAPASRACLCAFIPLNEGNKAGWTFNNFPCQS